MEPAPATETPLALAGPAAEGPEPVEGETLGLSKGAPTRKIRSDAKLEQLSPARRERLRVWLEDENRTYAEVVALLRAEFNLTVGKSAVSLYWRRHLLPRQHEAEAEIAATIAALPAAAFDAAILNQARVLAWTALARPQPQVQDAAILLAAIHRAERLSLSRQRLALEERRLALKVPSASARHQPRRLALKSRRSLGQDGPPEPAAPIASQAMKNAATSISALQPSSPSALFLVPSTPARHQPAEPRNQNAATSVSALQPFSSSAPPRFPGYSALFPPDVSPAQTVAPFVSFARPNSPVQISCVSCLSWFQPHFSVSALQSFSSSALFFEIIPLPCLPCVP